MVVRELALLGNPVLRKVARSCTSIKSAESLGHDLVSLLGRYPGWGIAAPQVGVSQQIFVMATPKVDGICLPTLGPRVSCGEFVRNPVHFTVVVNPKVVGFSTSLECDHETCLSVPGVTALVPRHEWIDVEFSSIDDKEYSIRLQDHPARVFQHEFDHIQGIVFLDRVLASSDIMAQEELTRQASKLADNDFDALDQVFEEYF